VTAPDVAALGPSPFSDRERTLPEAQTGDDQ
jgi:hypothetical protein